MVGGARGGQREEFAQRKEGDAQEQQDDRAMADGERSAHDDGHDPPGLDAGIEVVDDPMGRAEPHSPLQHEADE